MKMTRASFLAMSVISAGVAVLAACGGGGGGGGSGGYGGSGGGASSSSSSAASAYATRALVTDIGGGGLYGNGAHADAHLINAWGLVFNPTGFSWVANNGTNTSTLYDGNGVAQSLVVTIPAGTAGAAPTGIVYNGAGVFNVTKAGLTGASAFIFATEAGTISGWSPTVDMNNAVKVYDGSATTTVYKGLALATGGTTRLYAADFHNNKIDVFDTAFTKITVTGGFTDPTLPAGYGPFNIQEIGGQLYVAYAKHTAGSDDEADGAGFGLVDVFDTNGTLVKHLITTGGALNAPWGMVMAPANFGTFSNDLLVGNFGDGKINVYNPTTGAMIGTISNSAGTPIVIDGLWALVFGNGINSQPTNTLFYTAGPGGEAHGLYGRIDWQ